jgi:hypothetical protein
VALKGDLGVGRIDANVDASFDDILDNLNGALMLEAELRKGRFGLISDTIYANLEDNAATGEDRLKVDATANLLIQSLAGTYRVGTWQLAKLGAAGPLSVTIDPYAGARYTYLDTELKGKLDLPDFGIGAHRQVEATSTGSTRLSACARPGPWASTGTSSSQAMSAASAPATSTAPRRSAWPATDLGCSARTTPPSSPAIGSSSRSTRTAMAAVDSTGT